MDIDTYVRDLEDEILTAHDTARRRLHTSQERMKRDYDIVAATRPFEKGGGVGHSDSEGEMSESLS